jgi:hypothetical protein
VLEPSPEKRAPLFFLPLSGCSSRDATRQQMAKLLSGSKAVVAFDIQGTHGQCTLCVQPTVLSMC